MVAQDVAPDVSDGKDKPGGLGPPWDTGTGWKAGWGSWAGKRAQRSLRMKCGGAPENKQLLLNVPVSTAVAEPLVLPASSCTRGVSVVDTGEASSRRAPRLRHVEAAQALGFLLAVIGRGCLEGASEFMYLTASLCFSGCVATWPAHWKLIDCLA